MENSTLTMLAWLTISTGILALLCLLLLHFLSPEFKASWRMVSEYALGKQKWLLTAFFCLWAISSISLAVILWTQVQGFWPHLSVILLFISGIGAFMGAAFDARHKLHGLSAALGVPFVPVLALILSYQLRDYSPNYNPAVLYLAHATWISLLLMGFSMFLIMSGFRKAGLAMGPDAEVPEVLPEGVIGINGYANRLLVLCYIGWLILTATLFINL